MSSFHGFGLNEAIVRAIAEENYAAATPIQQQTIPIVMSRRDVIGIAQTGTGKTAAFALPLLHGLAANPRPSVRKACRILVLSPTRELSSQILDSFRTYGRHLRIRTALAIGGVSMGAQIRSHAVDHAPIVTAPAVVLEVIREAIASVAAIATPA